MTNEIIQLGYGIHEVEKVKETKAYTVYMDLAKKDRDFTYQIISWIEQARKARDNKRG